MTGMGGRIFEITTTTLNAELAATAEPINLRDFCVDRR